MDKYIYKAKLDRVVDGDTVDALIDVGFDIWFKKRIRFKGVDTWESRTRNLEEKALGLKAKARTKELLEEVSSKSGYFRIKSYGLGKYDRVLADGPGKCLYGLEVCKYLGYPKEIMDLAYQIREENNPNITDNKPPTIEYITIF